MQREGPRGKDMHVKKVPDAKTCGRAKLTIHVIEVAKEAKGQI
jgi:hypothetical protein